MHITTINKYNPLVVITPEGKVVEIHIEKVGPRNVKLSFKDEQKATVYRKELWEKMHGEYKSV